MHNLIELQKYIKTEVLTLFFEKLFHFYYGVFELRLHWAENMDAKFMEHSNLVYAGKTATNSHHSEINNQCLLIFAQKAKMEI